MWSDLLHSFIQYLPGALMGGLIAVLVNRLSRSPEEKKKMSAEERSIQAQTIATQGRTLADAFNEIDKLRDELDAERNARIELERELKRYRNYVARLQKQIVEHFKGEPVPFDTPPVK